MSEYQYYEWQALDRPLTAAEQAEVNRLSSHIDVTPSRAAVEYSWGSFKHDPIDVLARYFDAFLYLANWGTKQLAFRFPKALLDPKAIEPYLYEYAVELKAVGAYFILNITLSDEEGFGWVEGRGWLSSLTPLRQDILEGDSRTLYLAWLRAAELGYGDDDVREPPVPPGLTEFSPALRRFVEFIELDAYLLEAAAVASPSRSPQPELPPEQAIALLSPAERDAFLARLLRGEPHLALALHRRLQELMGVQPSPSAVSRRTWGELWSRAEELRREAERRAAAEAAARRLAELQALASREHEVWREVVTLIEDKTAASYDRAVALLRQLRNLAEYQGRLAEFQTQVADLQQRYVRRSGLLRRLQKAGLM